MEALHDVVRAGKARYLGASAMFAWQFQKALYEASKHGWTRFVSMQDHLNLLSREEEREMLPLCRQEKIGVIPYSPLASGRLTRDWSSESTLRSQTDHIAKSKYDATAQTDRQVVSRGAELAEKHGVARVHIALAWLFQKKPVTAPIIGATKITHLEDAVVFASFLLTGGALGARRGGRTVFLAGLALFALASTLCSLAPTLLVLQIARAFQGIGAALLVPNSLALLNSIFTGVHKRAQ